VRLEMKGSLRRNMNFDGSSLLLHDAISTSTQDPTNKKPVCYFKDFLLGIKKMQVML
jgi:hypothetical protein